MQCWDMLLISFSAARQESEMFLVLYPTDIESIFLIIVIREALQENIINSCIFNINLLSMTVE